jgi:hypothetical protein
MASDVADCDATNLGDDHMFRKPVQQTAPDPRYVELVAPIVWKVRVRVEACVSVAYTGDLSQSVRVRSGRRPRESEIVERR